MTYFKWSHDSPVVNTSGSLDSPVVNKKGVDYKYK